jgi:long-subunit acyl-CoA synthetase (AMP-forming)
MKEVTKAVGGHQVKETKTWKYFHQSDYKYITTWNGLPFPSIEIKFLDVPEAGYFSTNKPPQGEILLCGPSVTSGYYSTSTTTRPSLPKTAGCALAMLASGIRTVR